MRCRAPHRSRPEIGLRRSSRTGFGRWLVIFLGCLPMLLAASMARAELHVLVIGGLGGEPTYTREIDSASARVAEALAASVEAPDRIRRLVGQAATRSAIEQAIGQLRQRVAAGDRVLICILGHGTYDGESYKLNLPGPDLTALQLAQWLEKIPAKQQLIVNATSSSGASLETLAAPERILMTATRSGTERNATVFGRTWPDALLEARADLDRDGWISAREAFEWTRDAVATYYEGAQLLATEHAQLVGEAPQDFRLVRLAPVSARGDGPRDTGRLEELRGQIGALRSRKAELPTSEYYDQLEALLVALAELLLEPKSRLDGEEPAR